jgi:hypothetical protein
MTTVAERVKNHRQRMRDLGFRQLHLWVPDPRREEFTRQAARDAALVAQADDAGDDQDFVEAVSVSWDE